MRVVARKARGNRILSAEMLEPRTLLSAGPLLGRMPLLSVNPAPVPAVTPVSHGPTVASAAAASATSVTGTTVQLSVLGSDASGQTLRYTWATAPLANGAAAPIFSVNGSNAAQRTTVTFLAAGTYKFTATITDTSNLSVTSSVTVTVSQTLTSITVTPGNTSVIVGGTQQYSASALDQFGRVMAVQPAFTWTATAGTIGSGGLLTAPATAGSATIRAASRTVQGSAAVTYTTSDFLGLKDPALAALAQSLDAGGSITRMDMIEMLDSVAAKGSVSATDFADLQRIVADAAVLNMPGYVRVLAGNVVDGNAANADYQGQALGNLAAGSSAAKLTDLIDTWFYGTDLPAIDANVPPGQTYTYRLASGSLFNGTPSNANEFQGQLGDCYFISALGMTADASPAAVEDMFLDNGDGTWTVRFYDNGVADYVTVNRMLPTASAGYLVYADYGSMVNNSANTLWIPLAEKAYAQWNATGNEGRNGTNTYSGIQGGDPANVFSQVLGRGAGSYLLSNQQTMINALTSGMAVTICTDVSSLSSDALSYGLYGCHAYGVMGYNSKSQTFTLYNPWGFDQPGQLTWAELQATCQVFEVANASGTVPILATAKAGMAAQAAAASEMAAPGASQASPAFSAGGGSGGGQGSAAAGQSVQAGDRWFASQPAAGSDAAGSDAAGSGWVRARQSATAAADRSLLASDEYFREAGMAGGSLRAGVPVAFLA